MNENQLTKSRTFSAPFICRTHVLHIGYGHKWYVCIAENRDELNGLNIAGCARSLTQEEWDSIKDRYRVYDNPRDDLNFEEEVSHIRSLFH